MTRRWSGVQVPHGPLAVVPVQAVFPSSYCRVSTDSSGFHRADGPISVSGVFLTGFVNLYTNDIEAALTFYRDLLGFKETFRTPEDGTPEHVELVLNDFAIGVGTVEAAKRVHGVDASPGSPVMALVVWTEDVDKAFEVLALAGTPVVQRPHDSGNNNRNALLRDPDGNLVEIVSKVTGVTEPD